MLLALTYQLVLFLVDLVLVRSSSDAQLPAHVFALRHQLRVLECQVGFGVPDRSDAAWCTARGFEDGLELFLDGMERLLERIRAAPQMLDDQVLTWSVGNQLSIVPVSSSASTLNVEGAG